MKHFAKSLVSVVIALSILATMCIVGVSAVAAEADTNTVGYTLVSANVTKKAENVATMNPSVDPNKATVSVVNTADLTGGVKGVPSAQAYKVETVKKENGIVFPVSLSDQAAADVKTNGGYLDAWVHVGTATASNIVIRMYKTGARNTGGTTPTYGAGREGHSYNGNSWESGIQTWTAGWYHFVWKINAGTDFTGLAELSVHDHKNGVNTDVNTVTFSVAAVRIVPTQADAEKAWAPAPAEPKDSYTLFVDSAETGYTGVAGEWDTADKKEGEASYKIAGTSQAAVMIATEMVAEQDWNGYFWYYIEDTTKLNELYFEISSSGSHSGACVRYLINGDYKSKLKNGWNKIEFKLHDSTDLTNANGEKATTFSENYKYCLGGGMTGNVDWSKINYIRIISNCVANSNVVVKYNAFTLAKPVVEPEKDANSVGTTIVSANLAKTEDGFTATANGTDAKIVKTADLKGGTAGVPSADAYKVTTAGDKAGLVMKVENTDWTVPAKANLVNYGVNMWVWVADASKASNFVLRFFEPGLRNGVDNWAFQVTSVHDKTVKLQNGWNNVTFWFAGASNVDYDRRPTGNGPDAQKNPALGDGSVISEFAVIEYTETQGQEIAVACARLITRTDNANGSWTAGSATGDAVNVAIVVVAILLAAMAASVTVYFGKKVR